MLMTKILLVMMKILVDTYGCELCWKMDIWGKSIKKVSSNISYYILQFIYMLSLCWTFISIKLKLRNKLDTRILINILNSVSILLLFMTFHIILKDNFIFKKRKYYSLYLVKDSKRSSGRFLGCMYKNIV